MRKFNAFHKFLIREIKRTDEYRYRGKGKIRTLKVMHVSTKMLRMKPYCEEISLFITVNESYNLELKIYTSGEFTLQ